MEKKKNIVDIFEMAGILNQAEQNDLSSDDKISVDLSNIEEKDIIKYGHNHIVTATMLNSKGFRRERYATWIENEAGELRCSGCNTEAQVDAYEFEIRGKTRYARSPFCSFCGSMMTLYAPCAVGSTVYMVEKDCDRCPRYCEAVYSDCVYCTDDHDLFDPVVQSEECGRYIRFRPIRFEVSMLNKIGSSIFLSPEDFWNQIDKTEKNMPGEKGRE